MSKVDLLKAKSGLPRLLFSADNLFQGPVGMGDKQMLYDQRIPYQQRHD